MNQVQTKFAEVQTAYATARNLPGIPFRELDAHFATLEGHLRSAQQRANGFNANSPEQQLVYADMQAEIEAALEKYTALAQGDKRNLANAFAETVPVAPPTLEQQAANFLNSLEQRGIEMQADCNGRLSVRPASKLAEDDFRRLDLLATELVIAWRQRSDVYVVPRQRAA